MEQRVYHGNVSAEGLADFLVHRYDPQHDIQAQKIGQGDSILVQIGHGDTPDKIRHAVTVAIAQGKEEMPSLTVTLGQRQWVTPDEAKHAAFWGLIALILTPWALFMLLWPLSDMISAGTLPEDVWNNIELYVSGLGATSSATHSLTHPHLAF